MQPERTTDRAIAGTRPTWLSGRRPTLLLIALVVLNVSLTWLARSPTMLTAQDDAEYILLGRALASGSYDELWRIDAPVHSKYPPAYPFMLALWEGMWGSRYDSYIALSVLCSIGMHLLLYGAVRRRFGEGLALATVAVLAVNPAIVEFGGLVASEMPYMLLSAATLYFLSRSIDAARDGSPAAGDAWMAAAAVASIATALTRTIGVALLGAVGLWMLFNRRWRAAAVYAIACLVLNGGWLAWTYRAPEQFESRSYVADLNAVEAGDTRAGGMAKRMMSNAFQYSTQGVPFVIAAPTVPGTLIDNVLWVLALGVLCAAGLARSWSRWRECVWYLLAYGAVLLVWRWQVGRFLVPGLVVLVPLVLIGADALVPRRWASARAWVTAGLVVILCAGGFMRSMDRVRSADCRGVDGFPPPQCITTQQANYFAALMFIREELPASAVLLTVKSGPLHVYTGHRSISPEAAAEADQEDFIRFIKERGASHILLASLDPAETGSLLHLLDANCDALMLVKSIAADTLIFSLDSPDAVEGQTACQATASYRAVNHLS